jgi:hypothetical protein
VADKDGGVAERRRDGVVAGVSGVQRSGARWREPVSIWAKSEFIDTDAQLRLGSSNVEFEGASWPVGMPLARPRDGAAGIVDLIDGHFDWHVKNAWVLPRRYSGLSVQIGDRRENATLTIRNVGSWDGDAQQYAMLMQPLIGRESRLTDDTNDVIYALTPFSIIVQSWQEGPAPAGGIIRDTYIAFFYTWETFIQESLVLDARRRGVRSDELVAAYQHRHANAYPLPDAIPRNPATLDLASFATPSIDWDTIWTTPESYEQRNRNPNLQENWARSIREQLFFCRLQTHLMVALAAACRGLPSFAAGKLATPLVRSMMSPPGVADLAPIWLEHALGQYDHAAETTGLLHGLAEHYGQDLAEDLHGMPITRFFRARTPAENEFAVVGPPLLGKETHNAIDSFRWRLFDASLDDASVLRWDRDVRRLMIEWEK